MDGAGSLKTGSGVGEVESVMVGVEIGGVKVKFLDRWISACRGFVNVAIV